MTMHWNTLKPRFQRITGFDVPMPYLLSEDFYLPDAGRVLEAIVNVKNYQ